jgi:hypothetical protein
MKNYKGNDKGSYKYFAPTPKTAEELKKKYRELVFKHHPDNGGNAEDMKAVNAEYRKLFDKLKDIHQTKDGDTYTSKNPTNEAAEDFINLINELMKLENMIIEVIGCFIWVSGNTKPHKEKLKELKFKWHSKKLCWFLAPEDYRKRSRKDYDLEEIRAMYGTSGQVKSNGATKIDGKTSA